jgi:phosphoribosyl 1,2-cyclic phosphodiesterase
MKFTVLNSGSSGNCYLLENESECLIIELGVHFKKVKQALGFNLSKVTAAIVSHLHGDHSCGIRDALNAGITVVTGKGTSDGLGIYHHNLVHILPMQKLKVGNFEVIAFPVHHDCPDPFGYLIKHKDTGLICFITDTIYCDYQFPGLNQVIVEANYARDIIDQKVRDGMSPRFLRDRILTAHMEFDQTKAFLKANDLSKVNNIVLIHLSDSNSHAARFQREVQELTGKSTYIAKPGLVIENFGLTPF